VIPGGSSTHDLVVMWEYGDMLPFSLEGKQECVAVPGLESSSTHDLVNIWETGRDQEGKAVQRRRLNV
jgi:hypothetical protein